MPTTGVGASVAPKEQREITEQMDLMDTNLDRLSDIVSNLPKDLEPILRSREEPPTETKVDHVSCGVPLAELLYCFNERLNYCNEELTTKVMDRIGI